MGLLKVCAAQAGLGGWARSCGHAAGRCCCSLAFGGPCANSAPEPAAGICGGVDRCGHCIPRWNYCLRLVCHTYSRLLRIRNVNFVCTFIPLFLPHSGLLLRFVCAVYFLGPGAVQQSMLPDTPRPPGHASCSLAVPAGVAGGHAGCKGDLPYVFCPGL